MKYPIDYKNDFIKLGKNVRNDIFELLIYLRKKLEPGFIDYNKNFNEIEYYCPDNFDFDIMINGLWYAPSKLIVTNIRNGEYISIKILSDGLEYNVTEFEQIIDLYDYLYYLYKDYI